MKDTWQRGVLRREVVGVGERFQERSDMSEMKIL